MTLFLTNYRRFESLELKLDPQVTLVIGSNGSGKSSIVQALSDGLGVLLKGVVGRDASIVDVGRDARRVRVDSMGLAQALPQYPCYVELAGALSGDDVSWYVGRTKASGRTAYSKKGRRWMEGLVDRALDVETASETELPVIAVYSTDRAWSDLWTWDEEVSNNRLRGYEQAQMPAAAYDTMLTWVRAMSQAEFQRRQRSPHLAAVMNCIKSMLSRADEVYYDPIEEDLVVSLKDDAPIPLSQHSDGYRSLVGLVADLAWRSVVLNPHLGENAAKKATGVVVIDEIGLHLHPKWQQHVLPDLVRTFPNVQFVVSTHSPLVVASAHSSWLRVLAADGKVAEVGHTEGRDANAILEEFMGAPARPRAVSKKLSRLATLIEDGDEDGALRACSDLEKLLGPNDPVLNGYRWELDDILAGASDD